MTQIIDHAIQIPVSTSHMWTLISNPENNPKWQSDCVSMSFLNSIRRGIGMRWRYETANGKSYVAEMTAWYEGLGFEYTIVDGTSFVSNKGRIRLQEVPEGTIVQWTFSYEMKGMLAGVRNALSVKRNLDNQVIESLRNLFRVAKDIYKETNINESKALMRDAPNVQERSSYKPRYPSVLEEGKPRPSSVTPSREMAPVQIPTPSPDSIYQRPDDMAVRIPEPPVTDEDTQPNPILRQTNEVSVVVPQVETTIEQLQEQNPANRDIEADTSGEMARVVPPLAVESTPVPPTAEEPTASPAPQPTTAPAVQPEPAALPTIAEVIKSAESSIAKADPSTLDKRDTATISVFDLFGLPRPSMTQEMAAVAPAPPVTEPPSSSPITDSAPVEEVAAPVNTTPPEELVEAIPQLTAEPELIQSDNVVVPSPTEPEVVISADEIASAETVVDEEIAAVSTANPAPLPLDWPSARITADVTYQAPRMGLRKRLRQKLVKLRRAGS